MAVKLALNSKEEYNLDQEVCFIPSLTYFIKPRYQSKRISELQLAPWLPPVWMFWSDCAVWDEVKCWIDELYSNGTVAVKYDTNKVDYMHTRSTATQMHQRLFASNLPSMNLTQFLRTNGKTRPKIWRRSQSPICFSLGGIDRARVLVDRGENMKKQNEIRTAENQEKHSQQIIKKIGASASISRKRKSSCEPEVETSRSQASASPLPGEKIRRDHGSRRLPELQWLTVAGWGPLERDDNRTTGPLLHY